MKLAPQLTHDIILQLVCIWMFLKIYAVEHGCQNSEKAMLVRYNCSLTIFPGGFGKAEPDRAGEQ
jgi:hypothetical protein